MHTKVIGMEEIQSISVAKVTGYTVVKRIIDIIISSVALIVFMPVFLIVMIAIRLESKGKAIYTQQRIGLNGKLFKLYKFRSMVIDADEKLAYLLATDEKMREEYEINKKLANDPRVTKIGRFIRRTSIDELPQLINVFLGHMSIVGNRPYLPKEKEDMEPFYDMIVRTKPGITGLWQVSGRSNTTFRTRCSIEANYSRKSSFKTDVKIFFKTFKVVLGGIGAK